MYLLFSSKNTVNILMKNLLDVFLGGVSYWAIGWGLAYGDNGNPFCGGDHFFNYELDYSAYPKWFFQVKNIGKPYRQNIIKQSCFSLYSQLQQQQLYLELWLRDASSWLISHTLSSSQVNLPITCTSM